MSGKIELAAAISDALRRLDCQMSTWAFDALAAVYAILASIDPRLLQDSGRVIESMLLDADGALAERLLAGEVPMGTASDFKQCLLDAMRLLRALEDIAAEATTRHFVSDLGEDLENAWRTSDGDHYVIPRMATFRPQEGKPFLRRALRHFRVVPTQMDGHRVRLHAISSIAGTGERERAATLEGDCYGAALFPQLAAATTSPAQGEFLVSAVSGFDASRDLAGHIEQARRHDCIAVVWAELTMPEENIELLRCHLARTALDGSPPFRFLVAGSWHREVDGQMRNVAPVLGSDGETLFEVFKWAKFEFEGQVEAIVPGEEIHLLIGEDAVSVIAICRDFLDEMSEVPYRRLDVDIAIVPSMTSTLDDLKTMRGHAATAQTMRVRYGTRTMVVAQPVAPGQGGVGRVLDFPAEPPAAADGVTVDGPWHLCRLVKS